VGQCWLMSVCVSDCAGIENSCRASLSAIKLEGIGGAKISSLFKLE
jgi:hypothetical protein